MKKEWQIVPRRSLRYTGSLRRIALFSPFGPLVLGVTLSHAQPPDEGRKQATAVRVAAESIRLDGRLDEEAWRDVPAVVDFVQKEPVEGAPPTDRMEVRFAYDDSALYVGARMYAQGAVRAPLGRRDESGQAEQLLISLDTYLDRRTASTFGVTASGVRLDRYYATDNDWNDDPGFNPVWQARAAVDAQGWTAELWIPFTQLRFTDRNPQVWGLNVQRIVPSRNEEVFWALVPRTDERWASLFGELRGIEGIRPSRRFELLPYAATDSRIAGDRDRDDPFSGGDIDGRVGLDLKVGLGSNLTLEATANPDFGQVEADPAEVNLSAFETFFDERRPFFLEGSQLLTGSVDNYFYSRRIGASPAGRASGDFVDHPSTSTILGAAKLTGRLPSGTSVGFLGAVTAPEFARTFSAAGAGDQFGRERVAAATTYGVARVQQEFGAAGSSVGLMTTAVHRALSPGEPLSALLTRNAFSISGDSLLRLRDGEYDLSFFGGLAYVDGDAAAIDRLQRSSARYFQRPDVSYVRYDPLRTSLTGVKAGAGIERQRGRHWIWEVTGQIESPEFETNDLGRTSSADGITADAVLEYRETVPGRWWQNYSITVETGNEWNYAGDRQNRSVSPGFEVRWPNFWETRFGSTLNLRAQDERLTRGGPSMEKPRGWRLELETESSDASSTRGGVGAAYGRDEDGGLELAIETELSLQPGPRWQLSINPRYDRQVATQQYVTTIPGIPGTAGGGAATFGSRYVFGHIDRSTYSTEIRLNYTFKPDLTLDLYAEPFSASGRYDHLGELAATRTRQVRRYGTDGTTIAERPDGGIQVTDGGASFVLRDGDFNVRSFRSNLVLRWEWRAGSTLYLVWQQDRSAEHISRERTTPRQMFSSFGAPGDNRFAVKASFWISP
jgi:hypothetical protein